MKDAERDLWERYRAGDEETTEELILYYTGWVAYLANYVAGIAPAVDREDLIQTGLIVLTRLLPRFDLERGNEFTTYSRKWVLEALKDYLQADRNLTDYLYRQCRKVDRAQESLRLKLDREPTVAEIAEEAELNSEQVERALAAWAIVNPEELINDDHALPMSSVIVETPENNILIGELLTKLSERERLIIVEYYSWGRTDNEIAQQIGLTPANVKRIRGRALKKLAKMVEATGRWAL